MPLRKNVSGKISGRTGTKMLSDFFLSDKAKDFITFAFFLNFF